MNEPNFFYFDLIELYLENRLTPEKKQEFENRLKSDDLLKKEFQQYSELVEGIKDAVLLEELREKLRAISGSVKKEPAENSGPKSIEGP